jgi:hypothetical protein
MMQIETLEDREVRELLSLPEGKVVLEEGTA